MDTVYFHILDSVNNTAMNVEAQMSFWGSDFVFSVCISKSGIVGSYNSSRTSISLV